MSNRDLQQKGEQVLMNTYGRLPIAMVKGQGSKVYDADGKEYLDFVAGIAVNNLGHCHPAVVDAIQKQAATLLHCSNLYWIEPQIKLAELLVENSCFDQVFFCNSGAEANEGAIKLARKYAKSKGRTDSYEVISMENSFHGRTLATLTATGQEKIRENFAVLPSGFKYVPFNDIQAIREAISPQTCAIMVEPVQGEGGVIPAEDAYLSELRRLCDEHDLLLIFDEVQVGLGRTGKLFAYQNSGVEPDVMTLAKALGGGTPVGALMAKKAAAAFVPGEHATTFGGNPLVTAAGIAFMETMLKEDICGQAMAGSKYMKEKLLSLQAEFPCLCEVRGLGWLMGVVLDKPGAAIVNSCLEKGLLINCTAENVLRFVPPLNVSFAEIDRAVEILAAALKENNC
ncbi:MAG: acetylornithine transaminase [Bacillota bacterium]|jgi:acetylornithine/N-succinyldiaminopimelate aminotransferase